MTPLGHAAIGFITGRSFPRLPMAPLLVGSLLPDIDFAAFIFGELNGAHRGATHSIAFAALAGILVAAFIRRDRWAWGIAAFTGVLLHILVDSMLDTNPSNGTGVALFWPVYQKAVSPLNLAFTECGSWINPMGALTCSWSVIIFELPFLLLAGILLIRSRRQQR